MSTFWQSIPCSCRVSGKKSMECMFEQNEGQYFLLQTCFEDTVCWEMLQLLLEV